MNNNIPWYKQDEKDDLITVLEDKSKVNLNISETAGDINNTRTITASLLLASALATIAWKGYEHGKNETQKTILDTAVKLQDIDLYSRIELQYYVGDNSETYEHISHSHSSHSSAAFKETSDRFLEGVKNIFGERQMHTSNKLIWKKTTDNPSWGGVNGWSSQIEDYGHDICGGGIHSQYIEDLLYKLERNQGEKLVLIISYTSTENLKKEPVWKLDDSKNKIIPTHLNDPDKGTIVGFVFFNDMVIDSKFWIDQYGTTSLTISTTNLKDKKKGNENIVIKSTKNFSEEYSYIDLICVVPFTGPKVNKYSHSISIRGTYLLLLVYAMTQKAILLNSVSDALLWYLKLGGKLISNPIIDSGENYDWGYFKNVMKKYNDNHSWWNNKAQFSGEKNLYNKDFKMTRILTDNIELPFVFFTVDVLRSLYQNGKSNHFRARQNWDKLKKNASQIRLMKPEMEPLEAVAEGMGIKISNKSKKCIILKKKYRKTCRRKKNKSCKKLKKTMKKVSCIYI